MRALKQEMDNKVEQFELCQKQLQVITKIVTSFTKIVNSSTQIVAFSIISNEQDDLIRFVVIKKVKMKECKIILSHLFSKTTLSVKNVNKKSCAFKE